ncbi:hypothetical protein [Microbispora sp. NPDC049125]|uniref:hypothetical protein n=1 Tax=Microbispora sp. NPDC049125 TaxID=3154929 RepID=UPI00346694D6
MHHKTLYVPEPAGPMRFRNEFLTVAGAPNRTIVLMIPDDPERFRAAFNADPRRRAA